MIPDFRRLPCSIIVAVAGFSGVSGCEVATEPLDFGTEPIATFCGRYRTEVAKTMSKCFGASEEFFAAQPSLVRCPPHDAVNPDRLELNREAAAECLLAMGKWRCGQRRPSACWRAVRGAGLEGERCATFRGCGPGLSCESGPCEGRCVLVPARAAPGEVCDPSHGDQACLEGRNCSEGYGGEFVCVDAIGAPCSNGCIGERVCFRGTCRYEGELGDSCGNGVDCVREAECDIERPGEEGTCVLEVALGQPCEHLRCGGGFAHCEETLSICVPYPGAGEACVHGTACGEAFSCNFETLSCEPLGEVGDACDDNIGRFCRIGACVAGTCLEACPG